MFECCGNESEVAKEAQEIVREVWIDTREKFYTPLENLIEAAQYALQKLKLTPATDDNIFAIQKLERALVPYA